VFWRSLASAVLLLPIVLSRPAEFRPREPGMHFVRGAIGVGSMACYFTAIHRLPLGDAVLLTYLSPVLVALVSRRALGETPPRAVWAALVLGIAGVALVVGPRGELDPIGVLAALASAALSAAAMVSLRVLTRTDSSVSIVFWFGVVGAALASVSLLDGVGPMPAGAWMLLAALALFGTLAQWLLTQAYASADAARVSIYGYATPVFAYVCGLLALREVPPLTSLAGTVLVALAGGLVSRSPADPGEA
jgi:drug/metabolite transporter (DMT)-like permease